MCSRFCLATAGAATLGLGFLLSATPAATSGSSVAMARPIDCDAINRGLLNVELTGPNRVVRTVALKAGDSLDFIFDAEPDVVGSLTLVGGAGSPLQLLSGPAGSAVTFLAEVSGTFAFEFAAQGESDSTFIATCRPTNDSQEAHDKQSAPHGADEVASTDPLDLWLPADPQALITELKARDSARDHTLSNSKAQGSVLRRSAVRAPDGIDLWLGAKGQRYSLNAPTEPPPNADPSALSEGGLNLKLMPEIMVGALVQLDDQGDHTLYGPTSFTERGWMAGPMTSLRLAPGISLDARAGWGESASPGPFSHAHGSAEKRGVNARLVNTHAFGNWRLSSTMALEYLEQSQALTDEPVSQTVSSGKVSIRPEVSYRLNVDGSTFIEPKAAISSFWDIDGLSALAPGSGAEDVHLKAEAGVTLGMSSGTTLQATGAVQEGSSNSGDVWSGRLQLKVPLK
ncbi:MAG: hypothetical protein DIU57_008595 [Pseudomonadota bacterium]